METTGQVRKQIHACVYTCCSILALVNILAKLVIRGSYDSLRMNGVDSSHASPCPMCWSHLMLQACNASMCTAVFECLEHLLKTVL